MPIPIIYLSFAYFIVISPYLYAYYKCTMRNPVLRSFLLFSIWVFVKSKNYINTGENLWEFLMYSRRNYAQKLLFALSLSTTKTVRKKWKYRKTWIIMIRFQWTIQPREAKNDIYISHFAALIKLILLILVFFRLESIGECIVRVLSRIFKTLVSKNVTFVLIN